MTDDMGIRGEAAGTDLLAAVKLAVASQDISSKDRAFDLVAWIVELHEVSDRPKSVDLFIEAIKETKRPATPKPQKAFTQVPGVTIQHDIRSPNIC